MCPPQVVFPPFIWALLLSPLVSDGLLNQGSSHVDSWQVWVCVSRRSGWIDALGAPDGKRRVPRNFSETERSRKASCFSWGHGYVYLTWGIVSLVWTERSSKNQSVDTLCVCVSAGGRVCVRLTWVQSGGFKWNGREIAHEGEGASVARIRWTLRMCVCVSLSLQSFISATWPPSDRLMMNVTFLQCLCFSGGESWCVRESARVYVYDVRDVCRFDFPLIHTL